MNINKRILTAYNLAKLNIDITEILEHIEMDLLRTNDLTLECFELFDLLKYKYDKEYAAAIHEVFNNIETREGAR